MNLEMFTQYYGFDWLALIVGLLGMWNLGSKKRIGFVFYMVAALCGFTFAILASTPAYMVANIITIILNVRGYIKWGKENSK